MGNVPQGGAATANASSMSMSQVMSSCTGSPVSRDEESVSRKSNETNGPAMVESPSACVLAWTLSKEAMASIDGDCLKKLHDQIHSQIVFFEADLLSQDACTGLILGHPDDSASMTAADTLTRMGQLLCRWAVSQSPPLSIHVGVDCGALCSTTLPNSQKSVGYYGPVIARARQLAEGSRQECMVRMQAAVQESLSRLRHLPMILGRDNTFYLEAFTEVLDHSGDDAPVQPLLSNMPEDRSEKEKMENLPFEKFCDMLSKHKVDLNKYGRGNAKTLRQFYDAVVRDETCFLQVKDGTLQRMVELVRISLRFRDDEGKQRELRIRSQTNSSGEQRERNQPLAMVMRVGEAGGWQQAVEKCFLKKFGLNESVQAGCFSMVRDAYKYEETRAESDTIPGILTDYKMHCIVMAVKDRTRAELESIGLPRGQEFSTHHNGSLNQWTWAKVENSAEDELMSSLQKHGVDLSQFSWQSFAELHDEVYEKRQSEIKEVKGELIRSIRIIKVWLFATVLNCKHFLVVRTKQQKGRTQQLKAFRTLSMRMRQEQTWQDALAEVLFLRLGLPEQMQREGLVVEMAGSREEVEYSQSFPGLKTVYRINEVNVDVVNPQDQRWQYIGLPGALDFTFARQEKLSNMGDVDTVITRWGWINAEDIDDELVLQRSRLRKPSHFDQAALSAIAKGADEKERRQVRSPESLPVGKANELLIMRVMEGKTTDWVRARRAAEQIRNPSYSTKDFFEDVSTAFPELRLYCVTRLEEGAVSQASLTSGNRTSDDEYQRTVGALFCVFWLMRLHIDGKQCFSFGLDNDWRPRKEEHFTIEEHPELEMEWKKRKAFYEKTNWDALEHLVMGAGLLTPAGQLDVERTLGMLVLMVIHDVMKLDILRPTIIGPDFNGYKTGESIGDHDVALSYVLERFPEALPSFAGLSKDIQSSIKFSHCKLDYNMGWLVQAEAPPGALFRAFRKVVLAGAASSEQQAADIAFYFVHWFADLAGAEAFPLQGCEKFVLKFPLPVLGNFIDSFPVVWNLGPKTETQVFEDYLCWRWGNAQPGLGPMPSGAGSIAKMRLVLMAQGDSAEVIRQFEKLPSADRQVLCTELAMTSCHDQDFVRDNLHEKRGPAILVYYSPALMQKAGRKDPQGAMRILAEVFRAARALWPLSLAEKDVDRHVTVRIDVLKELEVTSIMEPLNDTCFVLSKMSSMDGQVKELQTAELKDLDEAANRVLKLGDDSIQHSRTDVSRPSSSVFRSFSEKLKQRTTERTTMFKFLM
eukprot:TRINITY_DN13886_c0_g1_i1.p1 TRINITY_DN13886_c0_g1~~TRINITY_DN13886_c0_g1_i1.p1  ORF type:complete len:1262 (+),score=289.72 TRINITY_DN13886_c0_g1_i1:34-3819(+)